MTTVSDDELFQPAREIKKPRVGCCADYQYSITSRIDNADCATQTLSENITFSDAKLERLFFSSSLNKSFGFKFRVPPGYCSKIENDNSLVILCYHVIGQR